MNRRARHRTLGLAGLLLLSSALVPLAHALQHQASVPVTVPTLEAWCDLCHQPFVAVAGAPVVLVVQHHAVPLLRCALPVPPVVAAARAIPRGPPAA